jgi:hypothetical protein
MSSVLNGLLQENIYSIAAALGQRMLETAEQAVELVQCVITQGISPSGLAEWVPQMNTPATYYPVFLYFWTEMWLKVGDWYTDQCPEFIKSRLGMTKGQIFDDAMMIGVARGEGTWADIKINGIDTEIWRCGPDWMDHARGEVVCRAIS